MSKQEAGTAPPRTHLFTCACGSPDHQFVVRLEENMKVTAEGEHYRYSEFSLNIRLTPLAGFFRRVRSAFLYVFNFKTGYWASFENVLLDEDEAERLHELLTTYRRDRTNTVSEGEGW